MSVQLFVLYPIPPLLDALGYGGKQVNVCHAVMTLIRHVNCRLTGSLWVRRTPQHHPVSHSDCPTNDCPTDLASPAEHLDPASTHKGPTAMLLFG